MYSKVWDFIASWEAKRSPKIRSFLKLLNQLSVGALSGEGIGSARTLPGVNATRLILKGKNPETELPVVRDGFLENSVPSQPQRNERVDGDE
jgi:hypothetical protein